MLVASRSPAPPPALTKVEILKARAQELLVVQLVWFGIVVCGRFVCLEERTNRTRVFAPPFPLRANPCARPKNAYIANALHTAAHHYKQACVLFHLPGGGARLPHNRPIMLGGYLSMGGGVGLFFEVGKPIACTSIRKSIIANT
jgi:hypothetical protein